jgi:energy-converting hydrogenase Eha subunit H
MLASGSQVRGIKPGRKSSACFPSEGNLNNLPYVPALRHVKNLAIAVNYGLLAKFVMFPSFAGRGLLRSLV